MIPLALALSYKAVYTFGFIPLSSQSGHSLTLPVLFSVKKDRSPKNGKSDGIIPFRIIRREKVTMKPPSIPISIPSCNLVDLKKN